MKWFTGSIPEAVTAAKSVNGIFIVYVYDKSEQSKLTKEVLDSEAVESVLSRSKYVAIILENGSSDAVQFAQIYPLIVVPSLFFISGQTGLPLEIIGLGGTFDVKTVVDKITKVVSLPDEKLLEVKNPSIPESNNPVVVEPGCSGKGAESLQKTEQEGECLPIEDSSAATAEQSNSEPSENASISLDEKLERAKIILAQKQELKRLEEIEEEKNRELERRRQSQEVILAKRRKDEAERADMSKQRKKDKEDERIAREKVKAQIASDRAERQTREALIKGTDPSFAKQHSPTDDLVPDPATAKDRSSVTRIKFRFPDNSSDLAKFSPSANLLEVRNYLRQNISLQNKSFTLVATLPHRNLTDDQDSMTLHELGLSPSAIIVVKTISSPPSNIVVPSSESFLHFFWTLLAPLTFLVSYLKRFLGLERRTRPSSGSSDSSDGEVSQSQKRPRQEGSHTTRNRPKTAYGTRQGSSLRREGNIHRLNRHDEDEDEDENNTWNGNSTQQM